MLAAGALAHNIIAKWFALLIIPWHVWSMTAKQALLQRHHPAHWSFTVCRPWYRTALIQAPLFHRWKALRLQFCGSNNNQICSTAKRVINFMNCTFRIFQYVNVIRSENLNCSTSLSRNMIMNTSLNCYICVIYKQKVIILFFFSW